MKKSARTEFPLDYFAQIWYPHNAEIHNMVRYAESLHKSDVWKKAAWRKKIKLAHKAYQRYTNNIDGYTFNFELHKKYQTEKFVSKYNITNGNDTFCYCRALSTFLLFPLRISDEYARGYGCSHILMFNVSNALGNFLTRIAKRKKTFIEPIDFEIMTRRNIPFNKIPLRQFRRNPRSRYEEWDNYFAFKEILDK
jgi:hypothetical protein